MCTENTCTQDTFPFCSPTSSRQLRRRSRHHHHAAHRSLTHAARKENGMDGSNPKEDARSGLVIHRGGVPLPYNISGEGQPSQSIVLALAKKRQQPFIVLPLQPTPPPPRLIMPHTRIAFSRQPRPPSGVLPLQELPSPDFLPCSLFHNSTTNISLPLCGPHPSSFTESVAVGSATGRTGDNRGIQVVQAV
jgi:hypothetical protein